LDQERSSAACGVLIPLYIYPGTSWDLLAETASAHPSVEFVAVVNPDSGPGARIDGNYATGIRRLCESGVTVLGYVWTRYASRALSEVKSDVESYRSWYGVDGIFFDEMSRRHGDEGYYSALGEHSSSIGLRFTVGNPGVGVPRTFVGFFDTLVISENRGLPELSDLEGGRGSYERGGFAAIAYGVSDLDDSYISAATSLLGLIYVTDADLPNPYCTMSPFLGSMAQACERSILYGSGRAGGSRRKDDTRRLFRRVNIRSFS
jgi:hypothetical protein